MAYDLDVVGGYGTGALGNVTNPTGQICSYANVVTVTEIAGVANAVTIGTPSEGIYERFAAGSEILIHASGCIGGTSAEYLGCYMAAKIIGTQESTQGTKILLLSQNITNLMPIGNIGAHILQAITIPQFDTLSIDGTNTIAPIVYDVEKKYGGVLPLKCKTELKMADSARVNLVDMGIPIASRALRYWTKQEHPTYNADLTSNIKVSGNGLLDTDKYSGWENFMTARQLLLNAGDGVCAIWAKKINNVESSVNTRIGGTTKGVQFCRGGFDSKGYLEAKPGSVQIFGGSSILLAADQISGFTPSLVAKYRAGAVGQGLGRCYIALRNQVLRNDEGLYAFDTISDAMRLREKLNIKNFGSGKHGAVTNPTVALNCYATVTGVSVDGKSLTYGAVTSAGLAKITTGALVLFQAAQYKNDSDVQSLGKIMVARIVKMDTATKTIVLDSSVAKVMSVTDISKYTVQLVSILETSGMTISTDYAATPAWNGSVGGVCAIACTGTLNMKGGQINMEKKGGGTPYKRAGLAVIGNAQMRDRLPVGQGNGSVFLLANDMQIDANSRIGAKWSGAGFGASSEYGNTSTYGGGYSGRSTQYGPAGSGHDGGGKDGTAGVGGYGCNGTINGGNTPNHLPQGAHIFAVIHHLNKMHMSCFSTGGAGGYAYVGAGGYAYAGAGYGGGCESTKSGGGTGGYNGGGAYTSGDGARGGSAGWCFLYVNQVGTMDDTGVKI